METLIKVRIEDDGVAVSCSQNGKRIDATEPSNIANIAGMLAKVAVDMVKYNNKKKKENE